MDENLTNLPEMAKWFFDANKDKLAKENALILFDEGKIPDMSINTAKAYCARCKIGTHKCSVQTRYGWCCDLCVEEELLALRLCGVHTMGSCCGHGDQRLA
ncbi:MAG: hypothetical protein LIO45_00950 [Clostridiales bacterium]|nr:hypothetical protein [Clostridiales bacterium]